jgi:ABC-type multidrug transport system ATPase subunit
LRIFSTAELESNAKRMESESAAAADPSLPGLKIDRGTCFGYRAGPVWKRKEYPLVEVTTPVAVGPGLHLFVAPNGTGKTTLLRALAGLSEALSGTPRIHGRVHYMPDELRVDPELKPKALFKSLFKGATLERAEELSDTLNLKLTGSIGKYSRGNRQKVLLVMLEARLGAADDSIVFMDEPLTGLDAATRRTVASIWADSSARAMRLVVLHELESVRKADSLFTISQGKLCHIEECGAGTWLETYEALQH